MASRNLTDFTGRVSIILTARFSEKERSRWFQSRRRSEWFYLVAACSQDFRDFVAGKVRVNCSLFRTPLLGNEQRGFSFCASAHRRSAQRSSLILCRIFKIFVPGLRPCL